MVFQEHVRLLQHLVVIFALAATVVACNRDSRQKEIASLEGEALTAELNRRVDAIIKRSTELTQENEFIYPDGSKIIHRVPRPKHVQMARGAWNTPDYYFAEADGTLVEAFDPEQAPLALAIDNIGRLIVATQDGVFLNDGSNSQTIAASGVSLLQWNHSANALLLSGSETKLVLEWPSAKVKTDLNAYNLTGFLQFAPAGNKLWLMEDAVDLSASSENRVYWRVWEVQANNGAKQLLHSGALQYSAIGTMPVAGIAWAHEAQPFRILSDPAPVVRLTDEFELTDALTSPGESVDIRPVADRTGRIFFVRISRYIEAGGGKLIGATARGWMADTSNRNERMISAEPTFHAVVSPDGEHVALAIARKGQVALIKTTTEDLLAQDFSAQAQMQAEFERNMQAVAAEMRAAWDVASNEISEAQLAAISDKFRASLKEHLNVEVDESFGALGVIDDLLAHGDGYWIEENAMVAAVGALYGRILANLPGSEWNLAEARPIMSADLETDTLSAEGMYFTLHSPFYTARERLAGRVELDASARRLLEAAHPPILLVENMSDETVNEWLAGEAKLAGITIDENGISGVSDAITKFPDNDAVNQIAYSLSRELQDPALMIAAGVNLARENPTSADALVKAAKAMQSVYQAEPALRLYRRAEQLAPDNPQVLFDVALGYFDENMFDEAEAGFNRAREYDVTGELQYLIEENLRLIKVVRAELEAMEVETP